MVLFWIGIAVFIAGVIVRNYYKIKYYHDYKKNAHTYIQQQEMRSRYRPYIFIGLSLELIGCIISIICTLTS